MKKIVIILSLLLLTGCGTPGSIQEENNTQESVIEVKETGVIADKDYDGIKITNIKFTYDGKYSKMSYVITNNRQSDLSEGLFNVYIKDKDGNDLGTFVGSQIDKIQPGESAEYELSLDADFSNAYTATFEFGIQSGSAIENNDEESE